MQAQHDQGAAGAIRTGHRRKPRSTAEILLRRMLRGLRSGQLALETPAGECLVFDGARPGMQARLKIHRWRALRRLVTGGDVGFGDGYVAGDWSTPDLVGLLRFANDNESTVPLFDPLRLLGRFRHRRNRNTRRGSRRNISAHYDLGNAFYRLWLDAGISYSSALFSRNDQILEDAQDNKIKRVIDLLELSGGEQVLEIGCGWGALAERLIEHSGCALTGLTLSTEQCAFAQQRLGKNGDIRLQDYRDVQESFDRIVSIEMLEAVGEQYWPLYFETLKRRLRPGGVAVLQSITIDNARYDTYRRHPDFIQKYVFPGGMLPTVSIVERMAAQAGLQFVTRELFGPSYARTLQEWQVRFENNWPEIQALGFDDRFKRIWDYYLAYCRVGFEAGALNVGLYKFIA